MSVSQGIRIPRFRHPIASGRSLAGSRPAGPAPAIAAGGSGPRPGSALGASLGFASKLRWAGLMLGPFLAFGMEPAPMSVVGVLALTAFLIPYNVLMAMAPRLPSAWLDKLTAVSLVVDFGIATGWTLLRSNDPSSTTFLLLAVVGFEAGALYLWKGTVISGAACILAVAAVQVERSRLGFPLDAGDLIFVVVVLLLIPSFAAGAISLVRRQQRELAAAAKRLGESESRLRAVLNGTAIGIGRIGLDGTILGCNPVLAAMLGLPEGDLVGRSLEEFVDSGDEAGGMRPCEELRRGTRSMVALETRCRRRDGKSFWARLTASLVEDPAGGCVVVVEDVTVQKDAERAKELAFAELERLSKLKGNFVSLVSHEFRTALVGIMGFAELMLSEDVPSEEVKEFAGDIFLESNRLNRLITDMLDLEKMEAGSMPVSLTDVDLNDLVRKAVKRSIATPPKHSVRLDLDSRLTRLPADHDRLTQVMANLLSNAVKYSPAGGEIVVTSRREGDSAHITVQDQGVGIPADSLGKVFHRYSRLEDDATSHVGGTGLGLPITKEIVELHGGRIWAASEPGHGATFHFTLPLDRPSALRAA